MSRLLLTLLMLSPGLVAWDLIDPARPDQGAWIATTVADVMTPRGGARVRFANGDLVAGCALVVARNSASLANGFLPLSRDTASQQLPLLLFAWAHGFRLQIVIHPDASDNHECRLALVRTCVDPASCPGPPPRG